VSPDPYGQFNSPCVWMGNNPVTGTDPDGGWVGLCPSCLLQLNNLINSIQAFALSGVASSVLSEITIQATRTAVSSSFLSGITASLSGRINGALSFANGASNAIQSNVSLGLIKEKNPYKQAYSTDFANGQKFGRYASIALGTAEAAIGEIISAGGCTISLTVGGAVIGVPAVGVGATMAGHGTATALHALQNLDRVHHVNSSGAKYRGRSKSLDRKEIEQAASQKGIKDRRDFGDFVEKTKKGALRGNSDNYQFKELLDLAEEFLKDGGH